MSIQLDITETGTTVEGLKIVGMIPETHESNDFSLFVHAVNSMVYVTNSIDDEVIASGKGFKSAMVNLANFYGIAVIVSVDPGLKVTAKMKALVGTYEPTITASRFVRTMSGKSVRVGDVCTLTYSDGKRVDFTMTAVTGRGVVVRDQYGRFDTYHWNMFQGLLAEGRIVKVECMSGDCRECAKCATPAPVSSEVAALKGACVTFYDRETGQPRQGVVTGGEGISLIVLTADTEEFVKVTPSECRVIEEAPTPAEYGYFGEISPVLIEPVTRPVTPAPAGTPCGWTAYGETGTRLTCAGGDSDPGAHVLDRKPSIPAMAVHVLTRTLPVAVEGTALCGFHSPYDVTADDRIARLPEVTEGMRLWDPAHAQELVVDAVEGADCHIRYPDGSRGWLDTVHVRTELGNGNWDVCTDVHVGDMIGDSTSGVTYYVTRADEFWVGLREVGSWREGRNIKTGGFAQYLRDGMFTIIARTDVASGITIMSEADVQAVADAMNAEDVDTAADSPCECGTCRGCVVADDLWTRVKAAHEGHSVYFGLGYTFCDTCGCHLGTEVSPIREALDITPVFAVPLATESPCDCLMCGPDTPARKAFAEITTITQRLPRKVKKASKIKATRGTRRARRG
jgi:hypothetical protein